MVRRVCGEDGSAFSVWCFGRRWRTWQIHVRQQNSAREEKVLQAKKGFGQNDCFMLRLWASLCISDVTNQTSLELRSRTCGFKTELGAWAIPLFSELFKSLNATRTSDNQWTFDFGLIAKAKMTCAEDQLSSK